jgi:succinoglycan biosynthesis transport protein ExoP
MTSEPSVDHRQLDRALPAAFDIRGLLAVFRRRLRLFASVALVVFIGVVIYTVNSRPEYTAISSVMLDTQKSNVTNVEAVMPGIVADAATVDTEVEVLRSRQLADRVAGALNLIDDPDFNVALRKPTGLHAFTLGVQRLFGRAAPTQEVVTPEQNRRRHEAVSDALLGGLSVKRSGLTYVIDINYTSVSPEKAALIANTYADRYLLEQLEAKYEATNQANSWLNERLGKLRQDVINAEGAVARYRAQNNLMTATGSTLTEQEISTYNQQLATVRAAQAEAEARLNTARNQMARGSNGDDVGEALGSMVVQQLRARRAEVSGRLADLNARYGPRHPEMLRAQRELADVDVQIQAEIRRLVSNLEAQVQVARQRTASMEASLSRARGTLATNNAAGVSMNELERNAESVRTLYESFLTRFRETSSQNGLEQSDSRVVSRAKLPSGPSAPDVPLNLVIGLLAAIVAGLAAIVLVEMLDSGLTTSEDVETRLGMAHLGTIPHLRSVAEPGDRGISPIDYIIRKPLSSFSEAVRGLRTSIMFAQIGAAPKTVVFTSALPGEGKTTTAVSLARSIAQSGGRVIVVDCDLRRRNVQRLLNIEPAVGLIEVLNGTSSLESTIVLDEASGAYVLPLSSSEFTPRAVFETEAMDKLLERLSVDFDLVILDTAPALAVADTRVLAAKADATIFVARWRKTPQKAVETALRLLEQAGANITGVALTQVDMRQQARYGYGDAGYYYTDYKKYYAT